MSVRDNGKYAQRIREEVASIEPFDALECAHREDALAWIDSGVKLCRTQKPATPPKHLVSYFVLVDHDHVLLVNHKNAGIILTTGGDLASCVNDPKTCTRTSRTIAYAPAMKLA